MVASSLAPRLVLRQPVWWPNVTDDAVDRRCGCASDSGCNRPRRCRHDRQRPLRHGHDGDPARRGHRPRAAERSRGPRGPDRRAGALDAGEGLLRKGQRAPEPRDRPLHPGPARVRRLAEGDLDLAAVPPSDLRRGRRHEHRDLLRAQGPVRRGRRPRRDRRGRPDPRLPAGHPVLHRQGQSRREPRGVLRERPHRLRLALRVLVPGRHRAPRPDPRRHRRRLAFALRGRPAAAVAAESRRHPASSCPAR